MNWIFAHFIRCHQHHFWHRWVRLTRQTFWWHTSWTSEWVLDWWSKSMIIMTWIELWWCRLAIILEAVLLPRLILPFQSNGSGCEEQNEVVELFSVKVHVEERKVKLTKLSAPDLGLIWGFVQAAESLLWHGSCAPDLTCSSKLREGLCQQVEHSSINGGRVDLINKLPVPPLC